MKVERRISKESIYIFIKRLHFVYMFLYRVNEKKKYPQLLPYKVAKFSEVFSEKMRSLQSNLTGLLVLWFQHSVCLV